MQLPVRNKANTLVILITILLAGDIELNPGPRQGSIFPCGMCERPVTWGNDGVCCDCCDIWHHKSRIELCTADYELLQRSTVKWLCCKCDSITVSSFTYHTYELGNDISYYESLTSPASFTESFTSKFSPLKNSSPKPLKAKETQESSMNRSNSRNQTSNHHISKKRNSRILTINCRSIKDKTSELKTTIDYTKPDISIGTESWLKGIKSNQRCNQVIRNISIKLYSL